MKTLKIKQNVRLAPLTSFQVGGLAENFITITSSQVFKDYQAQISSFKTCWLLGSGSNLLITDQDLPGLTLHFQTGKIKQVAADLIIADSGVNWDKLVRFSLSKKLSGIELMSGIPGTVGGAVAININAYGQSLTDVLKWVEIYDFNSQTIKILHFRAKDWGYKQSPLANGSAIILRAALQFKQKQLSQLRYPTALKYAQLHHLKTNNLKERRQIIMGTRAEAGSLLNRTASGLAKTCGSFFKNPLVKAQQLQNLLKFDETQFSTQKLKTMNRLHGGQTNRVSAAHVLLAAGFYRGQSFGRVRLHPSHVLKIENYQKASALEIYQVAKMIQATVKMKLDIDLEFEVSLLGDFSKAKIV